MLRLKLIIVLSIYISVGELFSQTVNIGTMYVSPDTKFSTVARFDNKLTGRFFNDGDAYIYSHFVNNGLVDYYEGGLTRFQGSAVQWIEGNSRSNLYNVLFRNTSAINPFQLSGIISVSNISNFDLGVVNNNDFGGTFIFEENATHINTSDDSFVSGYVIKEGEEPFTYPIGYGDYYRIARTTPLAVEKQDFEGRYHLDNSNSIYPHARRESHIDFINNEHWIMDRLEGATDILLTLTWREETTNFDIYQEVDEFAIHIVRWDTATQLWVDEGGIVDPVEKTVTAPVRGFGVFTLARIRVLPEGDDIEIFNGITPGDDGLNDIFLIGNIENYPNNNVKIFNRWGVKVFDKDGYNNNDVAFRGISEGRLTIAQNQELPSGTYYYVMRFHGDENPGRKVYTGFLYIYD